MKSGIRSIGLNAYATTHTATTFAYHGVRGSRTARYSAYVSRLMSLAHARTRAKRLGLSACIAVGGSTSVAALAPVDALPMPRRLLPGAAPQSTGLRPPP